MNKPQFVTDIMQQLGGSHFIAMTGAKNFVYDRNNMYLMFAIGRNASKANRVKISVNYKDLYDIEFIKYRDYKCKVIMKDGQPIGFEEKQPEYKVVKEYKDIYCDQLQELFTETTGMYTYL